MIGETGDVAVAVVGPYPSPEGVQEGWTSRIGAIDHEFSGLRRIYLNFAPHHDDDALQIRWRDEAAAEVLVHPQGRKSANLITRLCTLVRVIYVHTLHMAEHILPWLDSGKVCVDIHGVTPEEEEMLGRPDLKARYEHVEQKVLAEAMRCIAVSNSMIEHYAEKYPQLNPRWITIPIFEKKWGVDLSMCGRHRRQESGRELPVSVVYTGGIQAWQNVEAMLELVKSTTNWARYSFYSHEQKFIRKSARAMNINIQATFCAKEGLPDVYAAADFGLVLRNDSAVNRVACPTKLSEYLRFGVIPVVRSPRLGDFYGKGYKFVLEDDFKAGFFPDRASREWMIKRNFQVIAEIARDYESGILVLRDLAVGETVTTVRACGSRVD